MHVRVCVCVRVRVFVPMSLHDTYGAQAKANTIPDRRMNLPATIKTSTGVFLLMKRQKTAHPMRKHPNLFVWENT